MTGRSFARWLGESFLGGLLLAVLIVAAAIAADHARFAPVEAGPDEFGPAGDHVVPEDEHRPDITNPDGIQMCTASDGFTGVGFVCTRPVGHDGRHAAADFAGICAVWS